MSKEVTKQAIMVEDKDQIIPYAALRQYMANVEVLMGAHDFLLEMNGKGHKGNTGAVCVDDDTEKILGKVNYVLEKNHQEVKNLINNHF